jgi:hypothetical protein
VLQSAGEGVARDDAQALVWLELAIQGPADEPTRAAAQAVHDFVLIRVRAQEASRAQEEVQARITSQAPEAVQAEQTALSSGVTQVASAASAVPALNQRTPTATMHPVMRPMSRPLVRPRPVLRPVARAPLRVLPRPKVQAPGRTSPDAARPPRTAR